MKASTATRQRIRRRSARGKVAHLPLAIRKEIARRLTDGHSQKSVVKWLNAQPSVKAALKREQSGRALPRISQNNLSAWLQTVPGHAAEPNPATP
jgi:hypothetical protein